MNQPPNGNWTPIPQNQFNQPMPYYGNQIPIAPQKPSSGYKALGIIMLCLGIAGIGWALISAVILAFFSSKMATMDTETLVFSGFRLFMSIVTGALLVAGGFGIFRGKKWSRLVGIGYAVISICETLLMTGVNVLYLQPKMFARMSGMRSPLGGGTFEMITMVSAVFGVLLYCALPVTVLIVLLRAQAKEQLDA